MCAPVKKAVPSRPVQARCVPGRSVPGRTVATRPVPARLFIKACARRHLGAAQKLGQGGEDSRDLQTLAGSTAQFNRACSETPGSSLE